MIYKEVDYDELIKSASSGDLDAFNQIVEAINSEEFDPSLFNDTFVKDLAKEYIDSANLLPLARDENRDNMASIALLVDIKNKGGLKWEDLDITEIESKEFENISKIQEINYFVEKLKEEGLSTKEKTLSLSSIYSKLIESSDIDFDYIGITKEEFDLILVQVGSEISEKIRLNKDYLDYLDLGTLITIGLNPEKVGFSLEEFKKGKEDSRNLFFDIDKTGKQEKTDNSLTHRMTHIFSDSRKQ